MNEEYVQRLPKVVRQMLFYWTLTGRSVDKPFESFMNEH